MSTYKEHWTKKSSVYVHPMANVQLNVKFLTNRRGGQNLALHGETHFKSLNYYNYAKVYRIITST
jgi:hypothetical protein